MPSAGSSYPTQPCFATATDSWDDIKCHPAMKWLADSQDYLHALIYPQEGAAVLKPWTSWHTEDFVYIDPFGETYVGAKAWEKRTEMYRQLFQDHHVVPTYGHVCEIEEKRGGKITKGYLMMGEARLYAKFKAPAPDGRKGTVEQGGKTWDIMVPTCLHVEFLLDCDGPAEGGMKMSKVQVFTNPMPIMMEAARRGMISKESLLPSPAASTGSQ